MNFMVRGFIRVLALTAWFFALSTSKNCLAVFFRGDDIFASLLNIANVQKCHDP